MSKKIHIVALMVIVLFSLPPAMASDTCETIRFSDVGWTDITSTTAISTTILEALGYKTRTHVLSVPVTFASLKNRDVDVFLGLWLPSMAADEKPYRQDGSVKRVRTNLSGAKYTLAVPQFVKDAGITSFSDLAKHKARFGGKIYGIEPGNDGNRLIQNMIDKNAFGLQGWKLVESSEQGMLSQVMQNIRKKRWIVFLGWEPHPMNTNLEIAYLAGGDDYFGPDFGGAEVVTVVRRGFSAECPNVGRFLKNLEFSLTMENQIMGSILNDGIAPEKAARDWLIKHPGVLSEWLNGVATKDGKDGLMVVKDVLK